MTNRRGITLVELLVVIAVIGALFGLMLPAVLSAREAARRSQCVGNLKQIGLAIANYESTLATYPFGVGGGGGVLAGLLPRWSAQTQILPYLGQSAIYNSLNFAFVPWGHFPELSPPNHTALSTIVGAYLCPSDAAQAVTGTGLAPNNYRACAGTLPINLTSKANPTGRNNGPFWFQSTVRFRDLRDGASQTAVFSERCVGIAGQEDVKSDYFISTLALDSCGPQLRHSNPLEMGGGRWADGSLYYTRYNHVNPPNGASCNLGVTDFEGEVAVTASSRHAGGVNLLTADGSVRFAKETIDRSVWRGLGTISGNEVVDASSF